MMTFLLLIFLMLASSNDNEIHFDDIDVFFQDIQVLMMNATSMFAYPMDGLI